MKEYNKISLNDLISISKKLNLPNSLIAVEICSDDIKKISIKLIDNNSSEVGTIEIKTDHSIEISGVLPMNKNQIETIVKNILK